MSTTVGVSVDVSMSAAITVRYLVNWTSGFDARRAPVSKHRADDDIGCWGCEARLLFGLCPFPGFILASFVRLTGRFGQVFQRCVEAFFGLVRPSLFGRFPNF
jgi:hypothetical protein